MDRTRRAKTSLSKPKKINNKVQQKVKKVTKVNKIAKRTFRSTTKQYATLYAHKTTFEDTGAQGTMILDSYEINPETQEFTGVVPSFTPGLSEFTNRQTTFTIFKPCKNAMQNEKNDTWHWRLREDRGRGELTNQLAGDDYFGSDHGVYPTFATKEDAIKYCVTEGFDYRIEPEPVRKYDLRSYADNFKWKGNPTVDDI